VRDQKQGCGGSWLECSKRGTLAKKGNYGKPEGSIPVIEVPEAEVPLNSAKESQRGRGLMRFASKTKTPQAKQVGEKDSIERYNDCLDQFLARATSGNLLSLTRNGRK